MNKKIIAAIVAASVIVLCIGGYIGYVSYGVYAETKDDTILHGIKAVGTELGGRTLKEASDMLENSESLPDSRIMKVSLMDKEISFELKNAGLVFNAAKTASLAYDIGRTGSVFAKNKAIKALKNGEIPEIMPVYDQDKTAFREYILTLFAEQGQEFNKFTYELSQDKAQIKISDNTEEIDFDKLFRDALAVINEEEMLLQAELIESKPATAEEIKEKICVKTTDARADEKDGVTIIIPETNGIEASLEDITNALYEGKKEFEIPIKRENASVTIRSIQGDFFNDVLGTFTTTYNQGVVGRSANIALAASKINGTVLNVGDVFSYNDTVGRITASNGFSMATVYTAEGMKPGIGGGICQVSSTLYNAVLYADLKIVNRRNHSYTVGYVKNGLDATVSYPTIDFKFKNDTKGPVKITATAGGGSVTVTIYGKKQNNNKITLQAQDIEYYPFGIVEKQNPGLAPGTRRVAQYGSNGVKASVVKTVTDENGNVIKQESLGVSYYQPMHQIVEVGKPAATAEPPASSTIQENDTAETPADTTNNESLPAGEADNVPVTEPQVSESVVIPETVPADVVTEEQEVIEPSETDGVVDEL